MKKCLSISDSEPASDDRSPASFSYLGSQSSTGTGLPIFDDSDAKEWVYQRYVDLKGVICKGW